MSLCKSWAHELDYGLKFGLKFGLMHNSMLQMYFYAQSALLVTRS